MVGGTRGRGFGLIVVAGLMVFVLAREAWGQKAAWWNKDWQARRKVTARSPSGASASNVAWAHLWTMDLARGDGKDLRVVDEAGRPVDFEVMLHAPGVEMVIAYETARRGQTVYVYFGSPQAKAVKSEWRARAGLFMETLVLDGRPPAALAPLRRLVEGGGQPYGGGYRAKIFDGFNPFGSSDAFMSIYTGYFNVMAPATYEFATVSNDCSFVAVDDRLVCSNPARGRAGAGLRGEFKGTIELGKGIHELKYYHASASDVPIMELAWVRPAGPGAAKKLEVVPDTFFLPISDSRAGDLERADAAPAVDFDCRPTRCLKFGDPEEALVEVRFTDRTLVNSPDVVKTAWDFGDGVASYQRDPSHIFIQSGLYTIKLALELKGGKRLAGQQRVMISDRADLFLNPSSGAVGAMAQIVAGYPFANMPPQKVRALIPLLRQERFTKELVKAGEALLKSPEGQADYDMIRLQFETIRDDLGQPDRARQFLAGAIDRSGANRRFQAQALLLLARFDLDTARDPVRALQSVKRIKDLIKGPQRKGGPEWELAVLEGDCYRAAGDCKKAMAAYQEAERASPPGGSPAMRRSSFGLTVASYLDSKELDAAKTALTDWENECPTERLYGLSSLLWARYYLMKDKPKEAIPILEAIHKANPSSASDREIASLLATLYMRVNQFDKALELLKSLKGRYDDPAFNKSVEERITACEKQKN